MQFVDSLESHKKPHKEDFLTLCCQGEKQRSCTLIVIPLTISEFVHKERSVCMCVCVEGVIRVCL